MSGRRACRAVVRGQVQGVGFRYFTQREANRLGLIGWVRNAPDGSVEVYAEGDEPTVRVLLGELANGPNWAAVENVEEHWMDPSGTHEGFRVTY